MSKDWFVSLIERDVDHYRSLLEPLEAGKLRVGEIRDDGQMNDGTQAQIDHIKRILATLQAVLDREATR